MIEIGGRVRGFIHKHIVAPYEAPITRDQKEADRAENGVTDEPSFDNPALTDEQRAANHGVRYGQYPDDRQS